MVTLLKNSCQTDADAVPLNTIDLVVVLKEVAVIPVGKEPV
jgi:hypothetical protein